MKYTLNSSGHTPGDRYIVKDQAGNGVLWATDGATVGSLVIKDSSQLAVLKVSQIPGAQVLKSFSLELSLKPRLTVIS
jgi:hypothetical protein